MSLEKMKDKSFMLKIYARPAELPNIFNAKTQSRKEKNLNVATWLLCVEN
jgi:hypothetical protein